MTWHEARAYCRSRYTDLASVRSRSENTRISSLVTVYTWVGLHRTTWAYWSDRTPNTFSNWNQGQPNIRGTAVDSCAAVGTGTGLWWDVDCRAENTFVCQKVYSRQRQTFRLRLRSKADLKDPAVQQQILDQVQGEPRVPERRSSMNSPEGHLTRHAPQTRPSDTPLRHASQTRPSDTPLRHSPQTLSSDTPLRHSPQTLLSDTPLRHAPQTLLSDTPFRHAPQTLLSDTPLRHAPQTRLSDTPLTLLSDTPLRHASQTLLRHAPQTY